MKIDIKIKDHHLRRLLADDKSIRKATARSLNEILRTAKAQSARDIRAEATSLKVSVIKRGISDLKARQNSPVADQKAVLYFSNRGVPLAEYSPRAKLVGTTKHGHKIIGVSVKVK